MADKASAPRISVTPIVEGNYHVWLRPFGQDRISFNLMRVSAVRMLRSLDDQLNKSCGQPFHIMPGNVRIELTLGEAVELVECLRKELSLIVHSGTAADEIVS